MYRIVDDPRVTWLPFAVPDALHPSGHQIMANSNRRQFLKGLLGSLTGTVVVASTTSSSASDEQTPQPQPQPEQPADIQERAEQLANEAGAPAEEVPTSAFFNSGFRNSIGGGFRNGGFGNGFGGGFRNGGFFNGGVGGGFRNGGFRNGVGGGFHNGADSRN